MIKIMYKQKAKQIIVKIRSLLCLNLKYWRKAAAYYNYKNNNNFY